MRSVFALFPKNLRQVYHRKGLPAKRRADGAPGEKKIAKGGERRYNKMMSAKIRELFWNISRLKKKMRKEDRPWLNLT